MRVGAGLLAVTFAQTFLAMLWLGPDSAWVFAATHTVIAAWMARQLFR